MPGKTPLSAVERIEKDGGFVSWRVEGFGEVTVSDRGYCDGCLDAEVPCVIVRSVGPDAAPTVMLCPACIGEMYKSQIVRAC